RVREPFRTREKDLLDAQAHRRFQLRPDAFERQKAERPDVWPAAVEAMGAGDIAQRSRDLEPQVVEVSKLHLRLCHIRASSPTPRVAALAVARAPIPPEGRHQSAGCNCACPE